MCQFDWQGDYKGKPLIGAESLVGVDESLFVAESLKEVGEFPPIVESLVEVDESPHPKRKSIDYLRC